MAPEQREPPRPTAKPGDRDRPLTVEGLARIATMVLEDKVGLVWVEGEISGLKRHGSGHLYFTLKDARAQMPSVIWRSTAQRIRFRIEEGQRVLCRGRLGVYPDQGRIQLYVENLEPAGLGAAALALEQLKKRLAAEGLFDPARKRTLPRFPRRVGVVTSPTGAAVRDVIRTIERRMPTPILLAPTRVQGDGAAIGIVAAIARVATYVDVVIVGRGGGSNEDLSAFNDESVVRAIAGCAVPVISAVGHEVDVTLADLAADARASTPTAAAEIAVPDRAALHEAVVAAEKRLRREVRDLITAPRQRLDELLARAGSAVRAAGTGRRRALGDLDRRLAALHPRARLRDDRAAVSDLERRARGAVTSALSSRRRGFERIAGRLDAMSPLRVLDRGYSIARRPDGSVVASVTEVAPGDALSVRVSDGEIDAAVTGTRPARKRGRGDA